MIRNGRLGGSHLCLTGVLPLPNGTQAIPRVVPDPRGSERPVFVAEGGRRARAMRAAGGGITLATVAWVAALAAGVAGMSPLPHLALPRAVRPLRAGLTSASAGVRLGRRPVRVAASAPVSVADSTEPAPVPASLTDQSGEAPAPILTGTAVRDSPVSVRLGSTGARRSHRAPGRNRRARHRAPRRHSPRAPPVRRCSSAFTSAALRSGRARARPGVRPRRRAQRPRVRSPKPVSCAAVSA
jgi:hypothetical protein